MDWVGYNVVDCLIDRCVDFGVECGVKYIVGLVDVYVDLGLYKDGIEDDEDGFYGGVFLCKEY